MLYFREAFVVTSSKQMSAFGRPIVFYTGADPVEAGLVASLNRPGGNVTGLGSMNGELTAKRFGLLHQLLPGAGRLAFGANVVVFATAMRLEATLACLK
jgi:ABC-type uncharacterized transport system substrate-binding protein